MHLFDIGSVLGKNIAWTTFSRFAAQGLSIVSNLILARTLGVSDFGEYAFISAVLMIGNAVSTFGTDMVLIRKISAGADYSDISASLVIQLIISIFFVGTVFIAHSFFAVSFALLIYIFSLFPLSFFTISTIALRGSHHIKAFSNLHFAFGVFQFIAACILFTINGNITQLAWLLLSAYILSAWLGIVLCSQKIDGFIKFLNPVWENVLPLARNSFQLAVIGSLRLVYEKFVFSFLPTLANLNTAGFYFASARIVDAAKLGYISAFTPIYPEMARDTSFITRQTGLRLILLSSAFLSLTISLLARPLVLILFGEEFTESISSLQIMAWILIPYIIVSYYSLGFITLEMEKPVLISLSISLVWLVAILVILNQFYGLIGAALAVLSAEILQATLLWLQWRKYALSKLHK